MGLFDDLIPSDTAVAEKPKNMFEDLIPSEQTAPLTADTWMQRAKNAAEFTQADEQQAIEQGRMQVTPPANPIPFLEKPLVEFGKLPVTQDQSFPVRVGSAVTNKVGDFVSGLTSFQGVIGLFPPVAVAQIFAQAPDLIDKVKQAELTPAGSPERINAGLDVVTAVGTLGLIGGGVKAAFKPKLAPEALVKPVEVPEAPARPIVPPVQGTESMARYQYPAPEPQPVAVAPVEVPPVERTGNVSEPVPFVPANVAPEGNILPPMRSETQRYSAPEGVPVYPEGNTAADAAAWQRDLVSEGQRLGEQAALIGQRGMRIPTPLASRIAEINAELQRGYQPAEPEHYQMPETLTPEPATTSVLPVAPESVAAPEAAAPVAEAVPPEPPVPPVRPVPEVPTQPAGPEGVGDPRTTGVANRVLSAEAIAGKIGAIEPGEGLSWQEMVDLGRASGINPQEVAQRFKQTGRLSYEEFAALRAERERMAIQSNELADRANAEPWNKDVQQALVNARKLETDFIRNVVQPAKTATSNIFRGMQGEAPIDATTFEGLRRAIVDATGKEPTQHQATVIRNRAAGARKIADSEARALKNTSRAIEQEFPKTKTPTLEQLKAEMERMAKELMPCKT